jgi:hypothetical protein
MAFSSAFIVSKRSGGPSGITQSAASSESGMLCIWFFMNIMKPTCQKKVSKVPLEDKEKRMTPASPPL